MMSKTYSLLLLLLFTIPSYAQDSEFPQPFAFKVIDSTLGTKAELYTRARAWMAIAFQSAQAVVQMDDKDAGKIIGKGSMLYPIKGGLGNVLCESPIAFTVNIDVKDGKYRITLTDFFHKGCYTGKATTANGGDLNNERPAQGGLMGMTGGQWHKLRIWAAADATDMLASFSKAMKASETKSSNDGF